MSYFHIWQNISEQPLAVLITAIGTGALTVGALGVLAPTLSPNVYGVSHIESPAKRQSVEGPGAISPARSQRILLQSLTIRNTVIGITILLLNVYWQRNLFGNPEQAAAIRTCLGIFILVGTLVPIVDSIGAASAALEERDGSLGKRAAIVHALRTVAWLTGGIWCLMG